MKKLTAVLWLSGLISLSLLSGCGKKDVPEEAERVIRVPAYNGSQQKDCEEFRKSLPDDVVSGKIVVPENWDAKDGRSPKIEVFYFAHLERDVKTPPVIFHNGGPSSDGHWGYEGFTKERERVNKAHVNFVWMDQRGTGCSTPYPTGLTEATVRRLGHYGNRNIVRDSEFLRKKLFGDRKWRVFGQSYGGDIVHRYLEIAPEGIHSAHIHGSAIVEPGHNETYYRIKAQGRIQKEYFKKFPKDEALLQRERALISEKLCWDDGIRKTCGPQVLDRLYGSLGWSNQWDGLHDWIEYFNPDERAKDPKENFEQAVTRYLNGAFFQSSDPANALAMEVITFKDYAYTECEQAMKRLEAEGEKPREWTINECRINVKNWYAPFTQSLEADRYRMLVQVDPLNLDRIEQSLTRFPDLNFFLYAGRLDALVPYEMFDDERARLADRVKYHQFPNSGHEGFWTEDLVWEDLKR